MDQTVDKKPLRLDLISKDVVIYCVVGGFLWFLLALGWNRHLHYSFGNCCWSWKAKRRHHRPASDGDPNSNSLRRIPNTNDSAPQNATNTTARSLLVANASSRSLVNAVVINDELPRHVVAPSEEFALFTDTTNDNDSTDHPVSLDGSHRQLRRQHSHHRQHHHRDDNNNNHGRHARDGDSPERGRGVAPVLRLHHSMATLFAMQPFQKLFYAVTLIPGMERGLFLYITTVVGNSYELMTVFGSSALLLKITFGYEIVYDGRMTNLSHFSVLTFASMWAILVMYCHQRVDETVGSLGLVYIIVLVVFLFSIIGSAVFHTKFFFTQMFNQSELGVNPLTTPSFTKWWLLMRAWLLLMCYTMTMLTSMMVIRYKFLPEDTIPWQRRYVMAHEVATFVLWVCLAFLLRCRNFHHPYTLMSSDASATSHQQHSLITNLILRSAPRNQRNARAHQNTTSTTANGSSPTNGGRSSPRRGFLRRLRLSRNGKLKRKPSRVAVVVMNPQNLPALGTTPVSTPPPKRRLFKSNKPSAR